MPLSYGYVETLGFIGALEAADAMLKTAKVKLVDKREIGFGLVTVIIEGQLGAVQSSVDAGCVAAEKVGQLISSNVIPRPYTDADFFYISPAKGKKKLVKNLKNADQVIPEEKKTKHLKPELKGKVNKSILYTEQRIVSALKKVRKQGASLNEISKILGLDQAQTRVILKELLDKNIIEKVQQKYYVI